MYEELSTTSINKIPILSYEKANFLSFQNIETEMVDLRAPNFSKILSNLAYTKKNVLQASMLVLTLNIILMGLVRTEVNTKLTN